FHPPNGPARGSHRSHRLRPHRPRTGHHAPSRVNPRGPETTRQRDHRDYYQDFRRPNPSHSHLGDTHRGSRRRLGPLRHSLRTPRVRGTRRQSGRGAPSKRTTSLVSLIESSSVRKDLQSASSPSSSWRSLLCHLPGRSFSTTMIVESAPGSPTSLKEARKAGLTPLACSPSAE